MRAGGGGEARREEAIRTSDGGFCCGVGGVMQMFWLVCRVASSRESTTDLFRFLASSSVLTWSLCFFSS